MKNQNINNKVLYVFDLDDTIIQTTARIKAIHDDGSVEWLTSQQYSELTSYEGIQFDFTEFNSREILMSEAAYPLYVVFGGLIFAGYNVLLLTARENYDIIDEWASENLHVGLTQIRTKLTPVHGFMVNCVHDPESQLVNPNTPTAEAKKHVLQHIISKGGYQEIHVFEDSDEICKKLKSLERDNIGLTVNIHPI